MEINRKRVARRLASGLVAGALALGGLAISGGSVSAKTPTSPTTQRVSGPDRYGTSVAVARAILGAAAPDDGVVIASGETPYDALAAASLTTNRRPLLLVKRDSIPEAVADFLSDYKRAFSQATAARIYVVGGEAAISAEILTAITAAVTTSGDTTPPTVTRVSGADRYATAKAIADVPGITAANDTLIIVNGEDGKWADALSAGAISTLAGATTWPLAVTNSSGLQASAKAQVDSYFALPGSARQFLIVGGPAVVSSTVEEYLVGVKGVAPANVRRIGGADRYQTSLLVNTWMLDNNLLNGARVTLVSGQAPWDALGAAGWARAQTSHIQLTDANATNASVLTLAGTLGAFAEAAVAPTIGDDLWIIGGKSAVSEAAKLAYIGASSANNLTSTITECVVNSDTVKITLSGRMTAAESNAFITNTAFETSFRVNNTPVVAANVDIDILGAPLPNGIPGVATRLIYTLDLNTPLLIGDVVTWAGMTEGVAYNAFTADRSIAGSTCTAARDVTPPVVSMRAIPGTDDGTGTAGSALFLVTSNEPISITGAIGTLTNTTPNPDTTNSVALVVSPGSAQAGTTNYILEVAAAEDTTTPDLGNIVALDVVTLAAASITDIGNNSPLVDVSASAALDATAATLSSGGITCRADTEATFTRGNLTITAADGGTYDGAAGNQFTMSVVPQRGLLLPSVAVDATAKTITVRADVAYHTSNDVRTAALNAGVESPFLGDWVVTPGAVALGTGSITVTPAISTTGDSNCELLLVGNEMFSVNDGGMTLTVNGYGAPFVNPGAAVLVGGQDHVAGTPALGKSMSKVITFTTTTLGNGVLAFTASASGANDTSSNDSLVPVTFTVS